MNSHKRTNKAQAAMEMILVADDDQSVPTSGAFVGTGQALNLADQQIGVLSADEGGTITTDTFIADSTAATAVKAIKVVQGTPNSTQLQNVNVFKVGHQSHLESGIIKGDKVISVTTKLPVLGSYNMVLLDSFTTPTEDTAYNTGVSIEGENIDIEYTRLKLHQVLAAAAVPESTTDDTAWYLETVAASINTQSRYVKGHEPVLAFAINSSGSFGTTIGTLTRNTQVPFMVHEGVTYSYTTDLAFIKALENAIAVDSTLSTATIEVIDTSDAGLGVQAQGTFTVTNNTNIATDTITIGSTGLVEGTDFNAGSDDTAPQLAVTATNLANAITAAGEGVTATADGAVVTVVADAYGVSGNSITWTYTDGGSAGGTISGSGTLAGGASSNTDKLLFVGFDELEAVVRDETIIKKTRITPFTELDAASFVTLSDPVEDTGIGRAWRIKWDKKVATHIYSLQNKEFGNYDVNAHDSNIIPNYIGDTARYTTTTVEFYDVQSRLTGEDDRPKKLHVLVEAAIDDADADADTGLTIATSDTTTSAALEANLGYWLKSAITESGGQYYGDASSSTVFQ